MSAQKEFLNLLSAIESNFLPIEEAVISHEINLENSRKLAKDLSEVLCQVRVNHDDAKKIKALGIETGDNDLDMKDFELMASRIHQYFFDLA